MLKTIKFCLIVLAVVVSGFTSAADTSAVVNISATVSAYCSISVDDTNVNFTDISIADFEGLSPGDTLNLSKNINVTPSCSGIDKYSLVAIPGNTVDSGCLESADQQIGFCLFLDGDKIILDSGETEVASTGTNAKTFVVKPARASKEPKVGEHKTSLTFQITPQ